MFALVPGPFKKLVTRPLRGIGARLAKLFPKLGEDLKIVGSEHTPGDYVVLSLASALVAAAIMYALMVTLLRFRGMPLGANVILPALAAFLLVLFYYYRWPSLQKGKQVEAVERELTGAMRELLSAMNAGAALFKAMEMVAEAGHGNVSREFEFAVRDINAGMPAEKALEAMVLRTDSRFLKKMLWQIIGVLKSGASMQDALESMQESVLNYQQNQVRKYTQEMNLWILLYMIVAIAIPSLGATLIVVLSVLSSASFNEYALATLLLICFVAEGALIEYMNVKRPVMY
ncbi:MAG: type II secretion system F family protein [Candidatus Burarchaeum sp.]|nr:type II secretion system F family protein [Candidatus Burarchaeum sp.]MDO8339996.1 type II secretion system F family protein [Candidatus Burarchaeum sp.]